MFCFVIAANAFKLNAKVIYEKEFSILALKTLSMSFYKVSSIF